MISVFKNINKFAGKAKLSDGFAIFCARVLPYLMVASLILYSIYKSNIYLLLYAVVSGLFARFVINELVYLFHKSQRPAYMEQTKTLIPVPKNYSFPSGHASFLFGISFYVFFYSAPLATILVICSCLVGVARVFCGVHWFRDILAGAVAGFVSALILYGLLNYIKL